MAAAYATLPYWSAGLIRTFLRNQISELVGLPVEIADLSVSWSDGVEITGLRIASPQDFGSRPMVAIERTD